VGNMTDREIVNELARAQGVLDGFYATGVLKVETWKAIIAGLDAAIERLNGVTPNKEE